MTSTTDTWILVTVPRAARRGGGGRLLDRIAVRGGLGLLAWADRPRPAEPRSIDLGRVERVAPGPRPFC